MQKAVKKILSFLLVCCTVAGSYLANGSLGNAGFSGRKSAAAAGEFKS